MRSEHLTVFAEKGFGRESATVFNDRCAFLKESLRKLQPSLFGQPISPAAGAEIDIW
jgi:hypothetical protein